MTITDEAVEDAVNARGRANNPKWDNPIFGYQTFSEDQKEHLRAQARKELEAVSPQASRTPYAPKNFEQMVDAVLDYNRTPRRELFEYPHRDDDSRDMIRSAEALVRQILALERKEGTAHGND